MKKLEVFVDEMAQGRHSAAELLDEFGEQEVYFCIQPSAAVQAGPRVVQKVDSISIGTAKLQNGLHAVLYLNKSDERLTEPFAGIALRNVVELVSGMPNVVGVILQASGDVWISFTVQEGA